jgi:hypothetical protein
MRRERGEPERCCVAHVVSVQQHMLRAHVAFLTRLRRVHADYATSERDAKRARRADADYAISEREAKRARAANKKNLQPNPYGGCVLIMNRKPLLYRADRALAQATLKLCLKGCNSTGSIAMKVINIRLVDFSES